MDSTLCVLSESCELAMVSGSNLDPYIYSQLSLQVLESIPAVSTPAAGAHLRLSTVSLSDQIHQTKLEKPSMMCSG